MKKLLLLITLIIISCSKEQANNDNDIVSESALSQDQQMTIKSYSDAEYQSDSAASVVNFMVSVSEYGENPEVKKAIDLQKELSKYIDNESSPQFKSTLDKYVKIVDDLSAFENDFVKYQTTKKNRQFIDQAITKS